MRPSKLLGATIVLLAEILALLICSAVGTSAVDWVASAPAHELEVDHSLAHEYSTHTMESAGCLHGSAANAQVLELIPERHGVATPMRSTWVLGDSLDGCDQHPGRIARWHDHHDRRLHAIRVFLTVKGHDMCFFSSAPSSDKG